MKPNAGIVNISNGNAIDEEALVEALEDLTDKFWENRYQQINRFEENVANSGTLILKFFLNISKEEQ